MEIIRQKVARPFPAQNQTNLTVGTPFPTGVAVYNAYTTSQLSGYSGIDGARNDIYNMVLAVFQEPAVLAHEHGLHVDDAVKILGIPKNNILDALSYLVDVGRIYSTIDECHFKSACAP